MTRDQYFAIFMRHDQPRSFRMPDDVSYADSIGDEQMLAWCRRWKRGTWFGTQAAPEWSEFSFDCTRRVQHFLSFVHAQNAQEGNRIVQPAHLIKADNNNGKGKHAFVRFVQDKKFRHFNLESEEFLEKVEGYEYAEMV
jgi:hypothetical protein